MQQDMRNEKNTSIWNSDTTTRKKRCHHPATSMPSSCQKKDTFTTERRHVSFSMNTGRIAAALRMLCFTALMMTGAVGAWADTVENGKYYRIKNGDYYLWPSTTTTTNGGTNETNSLGLGDKDYPFITTYNATSITGYTDINVTTPTDYDHTYSLWLLKKNDLSRKRSVSDYQRETWLVYYLD